MTEPDATERSPPADDVSVTPSERKGTGGAAVETSDAVGRYIRCQMRELRARGERPRARPFVTISRQAGAGGHSLAVRLLERMGQRVARELFSGWQVFDQELCVRAVRNPNLKDALQNILNAEARSSVQDALGQFFGRPLQSSLHHEIFRWVRTVAEAGKAVIVGRGGAMLTRGMPGAVHVRLVAGWETRVRRMRELLGISEREAVRLAREQDAARARLVKMYFGVNVSEPRYYDAVWNTERVPLDAIADSVLDLLERRCGEPIARTAGAAR